MSYPTLEIREFLESLATVRYRDDGLIYFDPVDVADEARALLKQL